MKTWPVMIYFPMRWRRLRVLWWLIDNEYVFAGANHMQRACDQGLAADWCPQNPNQLRWQFRIN
jgi:hypothetical protein